MEQKGNIMWVGVGVRPRIGRRVSPFSLIFRANVVGCDLTGKNPNVSYEAGIAHTLGKQVVPLWQSEADVPFDLRHHAI